MRLNEAFLVRNPAETRQVLQAHARTLSELSQRAAKDLWRMGKILVDAQKRLASHDGGSFVRWVEEEAGLSKTTAYRLMDVYKAFSFPTVGKLGISPTVLYLLSAPSTPAIARTEAIQRATNGERITHAKAQAIVQQHQAPRPPLPPLPPLPPSPEYQQFEREELLPKLHDAGDPNAPQVLSGQQGELQAVSEERKEQARTGLKAAIVEAIAGVDTGDEEALGVCAGKVMEALGQGHGSIATAARIGIALSAGPKTLADLTQLCIWTCGESMDGMERGDYLAWRKRTLRILDAMTLANGCTVFEHQLASSGQLVYSLLEESPECP